MIDFVKVGKKIQELRIQSNLSQDELADKLFITRQGLSRYEHGQSVPSIDSLITLSKVFNVSIDELLCLDEDIVVDKDNIFLGHSREYVISNILQGKLKLKFEDVFYQFSPSERMRILLAIKEGRLNYDNMEDLYKVLTSAERYLFNGGKYREIEKSHNWR